MWSLIPLQYRILAAGVIFSLWSGFLVYGGWHEASIRQQAKERDTAIAYAEQIKIEQARGDKASLELATKQSTIDQLTTEKMRHVKTATTGRECLNPAAVSLLNGNAANGLRPPAGEPVTEDAAESATDTDITEWAIEAQGYYESCAARLNALIDWENGR